MQLHVVPGRTTSANETLMKPPRKKQQEPAEDWFFTNEELLEAFTTAVRTVATSIDDQKTRNKFKLAANKARHIAYKFFASRR